MNFALRLSGYTCLLFGCHKCNKELLRIILL